MNIGGRSTFLRGFAFLRSLVPIVLKEGEGFQNGE